MPVPALPTEIWIIVFEKLDLQTSNRVVRGKHDELFCQVSRLYDAGHWNVATILSEFERARLVGMRQYYNINHSIREAAERAILWGRCMSSPERPMLSVNLPVAAPRYHLRPGPLYVNVDCYYQIVFGATTPEYIAGDLYIDLLRKKEWARCGWHDFLKGLPRGMRT